MGVQGQEAEDGDNVVLSLVSNSKANQFSLVDHPCSTGNDMTIACARRTQII